MGIADEIERKGMPQKSGAEVRRTRRRKARPTSAHADPRNPPIKGARVIGKLPPRLRTDTTYAAGVIAAGSGAPAAAGAASSRRCALAGHARCRQLGEDFEWAGAA